MHMSILHPNLAKQIRGQAEDVIYLQPLISILSNRVVQGCFEPANIEDSHIL